MNIIVPCDGPQTREAVLAAAGRKGPFYIRLGRPKVPTIENKGRFEFAKAQVLSEGSDVAIIACGLMVQEALKAAKSLLDKGIKARVINMHTVKPLDREIVIEAAKKTKGIVVCEEHIVTGGLVSAIDEVVAESCPTRVMRIGIKNRFGQSGEPAELLQEYSLTSADIEKAALSIIK
jgi:transketolase